MNVSFIQNTNLDVVRLSHSVVPEDVGAHAVSPEARRDDTGLRHEGDEVVTRSEGHRISVGDPPLPTIVRNQPGVPASAARKEM